MSKEKVLVKKAMLARFQGKLWRVTNTTFPIQGKSPLKTYTLERLDHKSIKVKQGKHIKLWYANYMLAPNHPEVLFQQALDIFTQP